MQTRDHSLIHTLKSLKGNALPSVLTEPLWGIPYTLFNAYAALYMRALGVTEAQVGSMLTLSLVMQALSSFLSGVLTDKFGRRKTTFFVDFLCWTIPCLLWAFAQSPTWFVMAAIFNGLYRITFTSWSCLMVEDTEESQLVHVYGLINIAAQLAVFFAPIAWLLVGNMGMVPATRLLYFIGFVLMTLKFVILFRFSHETDVGKRRMAVSKGIPIPRMVSQSFRVFFQVLKSPGTVLVALFLLVFMVIDKVYGQFWTNYMRRELGISEQLVSLFPMIRSVIQLALGFTIVPRLSKDRIRIPMTTGLVVYIASLLLTIASPRLAAFLPHTMLLPILCTAMEGLAFAVISPLQDSLFMINVDPEERARIIGMVYAVIILGASPFGVIAGQLSARNLTWPFWMLIGLLVVGIGLVLLIDRRQRMRLGRAMPAGAEVPGATPTPGA